MKKLLCSLMLVSVNCGGCEQSCRVAFSQTAPVVDMSRVIVESDASCSGVIVTDQLVVTAKHCGRTTFFRSGSHKCLARLVWVSELPDGPAFYRVRRGFGLAAISVMPFPPKPGSTVGLYWNGQTAGRNGRVAGLQTVSVDDHLARKKYTIESNLVMASVVPGASGGAAVQDNQLAGIILHGNATLGETGICVNEDLRRGYMIAVKEMQSLPKCTVFTIDACLACTQFKRDHDRGAFLKIPVEFDFVNVTATPVAGVAAVPTYELFGKRFSQPDGYNGQKLADWLYTQVREHEQSIRNDSQLLPVPDYDLPQVKVPDPAPNSRQIPPSVAGDEVSDDDWKGVRIVGVASKKYSSVSALLAGPIARMVETMSNGKAKFETVFQASEPVKYRGIATAAGISDLDMPIYVFVLVDTIAEVNFVKGMILKKIENNIDKALTDKLREIPVEPVIRRIHPELYGSILRVVEMQEPGAIAPDAATDVAKQVVAKSESVETTNASHSVAGGFAFLAVSTLFRVWRFWQSWHHSGTVEQTLDLSAPQAAPPAATVTVQAPTSPAMPPKATTPPASV